MTINLEQKAQVWKSQYCIDANSLGLYRILFCLWFILFKPSSYAWIGDVPKAFYQPPILSFASLLNTFPDRSFFLFLDTIIALSLFLVAIGFLTRCSTATLLIAQLIGNNFQYSFGKIDHSIFVQCVLLVMLLANWGRALSVDQLIFRTKDNRARSIWLLAVFLAFGFFTAGFGKAMHWIDFDLQTNGFLNWLYSGYYTLDRQRLLAPFAMNARPLWIWEFADITAVIFELGFLLALFRRRSFMIWLWIACMFHLANCLILNISFAHYSICYLAFVPWTKIIPPLAKARRAPIWVLLSVGIFMFLGGPPLYLYYPLTASPSWALERGAVMWGLCGVVVATAILRCGSKWAPEGGDQNLIEN